MAIDELETDASGGVIVRPVVGWTTAPAWGTSVILVLRYAETPAQLETGGLRLQTILSADQAQSLAKELERQVSHLLAQKQSGPAN